MSLVPPPFPLLSIACSMIQQWKYSLRFSKISKQTNISKQNVESIFSYYQKRQWEYPDETKDYRLFCIANDTGISRENVQSVFDTWEKHWGEFRGLSLNGTIITL